MPWRAAWTAWAIVAASLLDPAAPPLRIALTVDGMAADSRRVIAVLRDETAALWRPYGVEIVWDRTRCAAVDGDLAVRVMIGFGPDTTRPAGSDTLLGQVRLDPDGHTRDPILISGAAIAAVLAERSADQRQVASAFPSQGQVEFGRAIGRVLAHELGHVLLDAPYHRDTGLMRARFTASELGSPDRHPFRLPASDVARLRIVRSRVLAAAAPAASHPPCGP